LKKQTVGIIGLGTVGLACKFGFEKLGHTVVHYDIKDGSKLKDVLSASIVFISVPTDQLEDGTCDVSVVEDTVQRLRKRKYGGIIVIKSTVEPGTTGRPREKYGMNICFVPEFLRERCATSDFVENHLLLAIGCEDKKTFKFIKKLHGNYPKQVVRMGLTEAEMVKYYSSIFNAIRVIFANDMYEACARYATKGNLAEVQAFFFGGQKYDFDFHFHGWDFDSLKYDLEQAGFSDVKIYDWRKTDHFFVDDYSQAYLPHMDKSSGQLMSLNVEAKKL